LLWWRKEPQDSWTKEFHRRAAKSISEHKCESLHVFYSWTSKETMWIWYSWVVQILMYVEPWIESHVTLIKLSTDSFISSPELKAQVSFSDSLLSVVLLSVRLSVNFYIFYFFSRTTGPILTRIGTNYPWAKGILNC
jgi:hypothetical protein